MQYSNPGFEINLIHKYTQLQFSPTFKSFNDALLNIFDAMVNAVTSLPRLETKLYLDYDGEMTQLKVGTFFDQT